MVNAYQSYNILYMLVPSSCCISRIPSSCGCIWRAILESLWDFNRWLSPGRLSLISMAGPAKWQKVVWFARILCSSFHIFYILWTNICLWSKGRYWSRIYLLVKAINIYQIHFSFSLSSSTKSRTILRSPFFMCLLSTTYLGWFQTECSCFIALILGNNFSKLIFNKFYVS